MPALLADSAFQRAIRLPSTLPLVATRNPSGNNAESHKPFIVIVLSGRLSTHNQHNRWFCTNLSRGSIGWRLCGKQGKNPVEW
jgi:hypothetical protein